MGEVFASVTGEIAGWMLILDRHWNLAGVRVSRILFVQILSQRNYKKRLNFFVSCNVLRISWETTVFNSTVRT